jgi:class 3 adenylate cyclase
MSANPETQIAQLRAAIAAQENLRPVLGEAAVDAAIAALQEKLAALESQQPQEEQRKQVTVLFADVAGFTGLSERMDVEDVTGLVNALWQRLDAVIIAHGGKIDKHIGDAVMALWGVGEAREDDPERAIRAALEIQAVAADTLQSGYEQVAGEALKTLQLRIGIHTGPVLLSVVGITHEFTAMGDTVNTANRVYQIAPPGEVVITHETYRLVRGIFDVRPLGPVTVKGKSEPVQAYTVLQAKPHAFHMATRGVEGIETRMVGRQAELACLQKAFQTVIETGQAQVVTVVGEAGVGKSRLLYELESWLDLRPEVVRYFKGRSTQEMSRLPYALLRDMFAARFGILGNDPAALAREKLQQGIASFLGSEDGFPGSGFLGSLEKAHFIGHLIGLDFSTSPYLSGILHDGRQIRDRAFHYAAQFFARVAEQRPVAIFLDDIHWADDGSLDFVEHLARNCGQFPLLIMFLARPEFFERRPSWGSDQPCHQRLELRPLSEVESHALVSEILQRVVDIPTDLQKLIVEGADGMPFYVEELIKMLIDNRGIVAGDEPWHIDMGRLLEIRVPATLTGVLQAPGSFAALEHEILPARWWARYFGGAVEQVYRSARGRARRRFRWRCGLATKELIFARRTRLCREDEYVFSMPSCMM